MKVSALGIDLAKAVFQVRDRHISICFVGDALTSRPDRVTEIQKQLRHFEWAANIKFQFLGSWSDKPYLNHLLHEFGHALGLAHEHARNDAYTEACPDARGSDSSGFLTSYDSESVMHYRWDACGIDGNWGRSGLSKWDRLGLHILHPENDRIAEVAGSLLVRATEAVQLLLAWEVRGANMDYVASGFRWLVNGQLRNSSTSLQIGLPVGDHELVVEHDDFLSRSYRYRAAIRVLSSGDYTKQMAASLAATSALLL